MAQSNLLPGVPSGPPRRRPPIGRAPQRGSGKTYAAIDLGTNNCRLLIARAEKDGFVVVDAFSRIVRLGEGLSASGELSEAAIGRAIAALSVCASKLKRRRVSLVRSVATEACRSAGNGAAFVDRVRRETGILLDVIPASEEARLAVLGCHVLIEPGEGPALVFDIGGGSTELVLVQPDDEEPEILAWFSAPWGVVSLTESEPAHDDSAAARIAAYDRMKAKVAESFADFARRLPRSGSMRLLGTSGTVTTLASVHLDLPCYDRKMVDGARVPAAAMRAIGARLAAQSVPERAREPCIGEERADLVVAGCAILDTILDLWPSPMVTVADRGIREGILRGLMAQGERFS